MVEKTKKEENLKKEVEKKEKEKKEVEEKIEEVKKEIETLPERTVEVLKEDKEAKLKEYEKRKEKAEKEIESSQQFLMEVKKEKEEIQKEIITKTKEEKKEEIKREIENLEKLISEKEKEKIEKEEILFKDSDLDGLSDLEEIRLGTDPFNPDSDGDGFLDGAEILAGYNPLKPGAADKIIYQDPKKVPPKKEEIYKVERIEKIILPTGEIGFKLVGKGLPNSFVTLYIFSLPIVVAVKTDSNGYWEYTLDRPIVDGEHTVYAAVTNNYGKIEARSEAFVFMKTGDKIFRIFETSAPAISPAQALQKPFAILIIMVIVLALIIAIVIIGTLIRKKEKTESPSS